MVFDLAIADDEPAIREGLTRHVDWARLGFRVVQSFEDGEDLLHYLHDGHLDVVLTDIRMSVVSGLDVAEVIHARRLPTEVVLLTGYKDFEYARRAMRYGVRYYLLKPAHAGEIREVFLEIHRTLAGRPDDSGPAERSTGILRHHGPGGDTADNTATAGENANVMALAGRYVRRHIGEEISMEQVAREFYFSPPYFSRLFRKHTGTTFMSYLTGCRMEKAETLLREHPELGISEIAEQVGYRDSNYFTRVYRRRFGHTPSAYRRMLRNESGR